VADMHSMDSVSRRRVLFIEDDDDYEQLVTSVLAASGNPFEIRWARSLAEALSTVHQFNPAVILLDLNLTDSSGYDTFRRVREQAGGASIIILTSLDDDTMAVQAIEDGAFEYLVKNLIQPELIVRCINRVLCRNVRSSANRVASQPNVVLSFIGSKGGVGTSTTAVNVAAVLSQCGYGAILIEFQTGAGTLPLYLPAPPARGLRSLLEKRSDAITVADLERCLAGSVAGMRFLCPGPSTDPLRNAGSKHTRAIVSAARQLAPVVILDLPSRVDEEVATALTLSDSITLVVDREPAAVHCGPTMIEQIRAATARSRQVELVIVDRTGLEISLALPDIKNQLNMRPAAMVPHAAPAIALSYAARTPLALLYPEDGFGLAHLELAEHLLAGRSLETGTRLETKFFGNKLGARSIPETTYS
jgi:MinD-like ATPase involved in chromosome partitioning or flagellar assembly/ActR/RegA family two-component response regulator